MCMSQYDLFQKCRIPRPEMDESQQTPIDQARHVLVVRNGHVSVCIYIYYEKEKERSKQGQTNKQGKATQHTQHVHGSIPFMVQFRCSATIQHTR